MILRHAVDALELGLDGPGADRKADCHVRLLDLVERFQLGTDLLGQFLTVAATGETEIQFQRDAATVDLKRAHGARADQIGIQIGFVIFGRVRP